TSNTRLTQSRYPGSRPPTTGADPLKQTETIAQSSCKTCGPRFAHGRGGPHETVRSCLVRADRLLVGAGSVHLLPRREADRRREVRRLPLARRDRAVRAALLRRREGPGA